MVDSADDNRLLHESQLAEYINQYRAKGKNVIFVHGHFSVVHPGHLRFLQNARRQGDILVVGVLSDQQYLELSGQQAFFSEDDRVNQIASINIVDHVVLLKHNSVVNWVEQYRPEYYVLGKEYENNRHHDVEDLVDAVRNYGGKVVYHSGDIEIPYASLISQSASDLQSKLHQQFKESCRKQNLTKSYLLEVLDKAKNCKALVIGDTIIDQYTVCSPVGMSSEAPVVVVKELQSREYVGGAAIVASHVNALGAKCDYISMSGNDHWHDFVKSQLVDKGIKVDLYIDEARPTTFKIRYMVGAQKLFRVSRLREQSAPKTIEKKIIEQLRREIDKFDVIIVSDFVYGVITENILNEIRQLAKKHNKLLVGDLQCSSQIGNVKQFVDFDIITPTEREVRIALSNYDDGIEQIAHSLIKQAKIKNLVLTMGEDGLVAYRKTGDNQQLLQSQNFPTLESNPLDVTGAGDSLLSTLAVCYSQCNDLMAASALGCFASAVMVGILGNNTIDLKKIRDLLHEVF